MGTKRSSKANAFNQAMGLRIRNRRRGLGLTQTELGAAIGITFQQIQKYETGVCAVPASRLHELAAALNMSTPSLLGEDTPKTIMARKRAA